MNIAELIAAELSVQPRQVQAAVELIDDGSTVPFIARYRKEATGGLDDAQLRQLDSRLIYLRELEERRDAVLKAIDEQGKLSDELRGRIAATTTKTELEDLYLPYKKKRRTKAQIAREAGLAPLAQSLLENPALDPDSEAGKFVDADKGVADAAAALDGARQILMEVFAEDAALAGELRELLWERGLLSARVVPGEEEKGNKFADYFDYSEAVAKVPSHRALALLRGRNEGVLHLDLDLEVAEDAPRHPCEGRIAAHFGIASIYHENARRPADKWLAQVVRLAWKVKLHTRLDLDLKNRLREAAEETAIDVFARNLRDLLLAAPAGAKATIGLDPGLRTGVKVAVLDNTGKLVDTATIYPHAPQNKWDQSVHALAGLAEKHAVGLIAIGNGTASRETDKLAAELIKKHPQLRLQKMIVSEAGASVYSASELASREMPDIDVSLRGAASIGRRLQDPLAELVKIEPKAIGVGQYQHDVNQSRLGRSLDAVVEDCVNAVGVDVNMASAALLAHVSGLSGALAQNIVDYRDANGAFISRAALKKVPRLGEKTFEQCAGFLRVMDGRNALDASAVHPEAYPVVKRIAEDTGRDVRALIGDSGFLKSLDPRRYTDERFGLPTVKDILAELHKPGRDPRPEFKTAEFKEGVEKISDLEPGMQLEGVVTNVTHFGAFVDVGVHQDGLVHISALADRFVKDPHEIVAAGDVVRVKVMEVDVKRKRIGLTMRLADKPQRGGDGSERNSSRGQSSGQGGGQGGGRTRQPAQRDQRGGVGSLGAALLEARKRGR